MNDLAVFSIYTVNYPLLTLHAQEGAFHRLIIMLHSNFHTNIIGTQKCVYRHPSLGNLDRTQVSETVSFSPLQDRFDSNNQRGFPIAVYNQTTPAFIQCIISRVMSIIQCTAFRTPSGSVVSINFNKRNSKHLGIGFKKFFEFSIRNPADFSIGFLIKLTSSTFEVFKFLNSNKSIMFFGKIYNLFSDLPASGFNKIRLTMLKPFKMLPCFMRAFISKTLKVCSSYLIFSLPYSDVSSKIKLFNNFGSFSIKNSSRSESRRTDVNAKNISLVDFWLGKLLFKNNRNPTIFQNGNIIKTPTVFKKIIESLKLSICSDGYSNGIFRKISDFKTRISSLSFNISKPPLIKANGTFSKFMSFIQNIFSAFPNIFTGFLNNIAWQKGGISYVQIC